MNDRRLDRQKRRLFSFGIAAVSRGVGGIGVRCSQHRRHPPLLQNPPSLASRSRWVNAWEWKAASFGWDLLLHSDFMLWLEISYLCCRDADLTKYPCNLKETDPPPTFIRDGKKYNFAGPTGDLLTPYFCLLSLKTSLFLSPLLRFFTSAQSVAFPFPFFGVQDVLHVIRSWNCSKNQTEGKRIYKRLVL